MGDEKFDQDRSLSPSSNKRKRAPNFTEKETRMLMKLVFDNIDMIESKKKDSDTLKIKDRLWNCIAENFNNGSLGITRRSAGAIRQKYDSVKKQLRKKYFRNKEGKGAYVEMEDYEKDLLSLLENIGSNGESVQEISIGTNIKSETASNTEQDEFQEQERFHITDEDMLWDLPNDNLNRPRFTLLEKQMEHSEREEKRLELEHEYRMRTLQIKRRLMFNQERRLRAEHDKRMELLELEVQFKRKDLQNFNNHKPV